MRLAHLSLRVISSAIVALFLVAVSLPDQTLQADLDAIQKAKEHQLNLDYEEAEKLLRADLAGHPDDLCAVNLYATVILYREMFRRGLLESQLYGNNGEIFKPPHEPPSTDFQTQLMAVLQDA